jgi:hypothetical protein
MGESSLYGPVLVASLTSERTGMVVVSVAEGAILFDSMQFHSIFKLDVTDPGALYRVACTMGRWYTD